MATPTEGYFVTLPDGTKKKVPSVTTIINSGLAGYSKDALMYWAWDQGKQGLDFRETRDKAASTGTVAHSMIEAYLHGQEYVPDPELILTADLLLESEAAFGAFVDWHDSHDVVIQEQEQRLVSGQYMYGGCFDALGTLDGTQCLFDWKSSKDIYSSYPVQLAAYYNLIHENRPIAMRPRKAVIVRIGKDGGFRVVELNLNDLELAWNMFKHALAIYEGKRDLGAMVKAPSILKPALTLPTVGGKVAAIAD